MICDKCGKETLRYRIVAHKLYRDCTGRIIGVENVAVCRDCLDKKTGNNEKVQIELSKD
jgi:hypothetical protein